MKMKDAYIMSLFKPHIWHRGEVISFSDKIKITYRSGGEIHAIVSGTQDYDVLIKFSDKGTIDMNCTCPYAAGGQNCKHMAAMLLRYIENADEWASQENKHASLGFPEITTDIEIAPQTVSQYRKQSKTIRELLQQLPKDDIGNFLADAILDNPSLKKLFLASFFPKNITVEGIVAEFDAIYETYSSRHGYINYYSTTGFYEELDLLINQLDALINNGEYLAAMKAITQIADRFGDVELDDSDGGSSIFYDRISERIKSVAEKKDETVNKFLYNWMSRVIEENKDWYLIELIYPLWSSNHSPTELIDIKISQIMKRRGLPRKKEADEKETYDFNRDLIEMANLMKQRGDKNSDIEKALLPFKDFVEVLAWLADFAKQNGERDKEEELLLEGVNLGKRQKMAIVIRRFKEGLCRLYQDTNREEEYKKSLREIVVVGQYSFDYYLEYKSLFSPTEWQCEVVSIIEEMRYANNYRYGGGILPSVYNEEKMYGDLMELAERKDMDVLTNYETVLVKFDSEKVIDLYCCHLDKLAAQPASNSLYELIVDKMKHIRTLPGGNDLMKEKAHSYSIKYKARRNFVAKLKEVEW